MKSNTECEFCNKPIYRKPSHKRRYKMSFCSYECQGSYNNRRITTKCSECGIEITILQCDFNKSKSGNHYCSRSCSTIYRNKGNHGEKNNNYRNGKSTYRDKAFKKYGIKCSNKSCILTQTGLKIPKHMLDVDHVDSNRANNKAENLQVLCVWCHALKTRKNWG